MAKVKAAQINEQKQGAEQNQGEGQTNEVKDNASADVPGANEAAANGDATASAEENIVGDADDTSAELIQAEGLGLRDRFAMSALQGMLANGTHMQRPDAVAYKAYEYADAMLEVRGK